MKQQWAVKIRFRGLSRLSSMSAWWQVKEEILYMHSNSKHPRSTLHLGTEVTENTSPTPLTPDLYQNSWITPAQNMGSSWHPFFFLQVPSWNLQYGFTCKQEMHKKHSCGWKSKIIPSKLTVCVRTFGRFVLCFYHNLCRNSLTKFLDVTRIIGQNTLRKSEPHSMWSCVAFIISFHEVIGSISACGAIVIRIASALRDHN